MRASRPFVAASASSVALLALLFSGCGSAKPVDVGALKTQLSGIADRVDACVAKTNDARKCATASALGGLPSGAKLGSGAGQIQINAPAALRYDLVGSAGNKMIFSIKAEPVGARSRHCEPAGTGACPKTGAW